MAPRQASKRAAQDASAVEHPAKRLAQQLWQQGVAPANYKAVVEVLEHPLTAAELPAECRQMLTSALPMSLCLPADERDVHQVSMVQMVGEVVEKLQAKLQQSVEAEAAKYAVVQKACAGFETKVHELEAAHAAALEEVRVREAAVAEAAETVSVMKAKLEAAKLAQEQDDAGLRAAQAERQSVSAAVAGPLAELEEGTSGDATEAHVNRMLELAQQLQLEDSLLKALPGSLAKPAATRGHFGTLVFQQLRAAFDQQLAQLDAAIQAALPAALARAAEVEASGSSLEAAEQALSQAGSSLGSAEDALRKTVEAEEASKAELAAHVPQVQSAKDVFDARSAELTQFCEYNVTCFTMLRDRLSASQRAKLAAAAASAASAADAAGAESAVTPSVPTEELPAVVGQAPQSSGDM